MKKGCLIFLELTYKLNGKHSTKIGQVVLLQACKTLPIEKTRLGNTMMQELGALNTITYLL
jgi:hypothetical protein